MDIAKTMVQINAPIKNAIWASTNLATMPPYMDGLSTLYSEAS